MRGSGSWLCVSELRGAESCPFRLNFVVSKEMVLFLVGNWFGAQKSLCFARFSCGVGLYFFNFLQFCVCRSRFCDALFEYSIPLGLLVYVISRVSFGF